MITKKVIDGKVYNTETAKLIDSWSNGLGPGNFRNAREELYKTKKGAWFICGEGGALSRWSESYADGQGPGEDIIALSSDEAKGWLENHSSADIYEEHFDSIEA